MRVIFMGTPAFALPALRAILGSPHDVVAVYTQPPRPAGRGHKLSHSPIHELADSHQLAVHIPASLKAESEQEIFRSLQADIAVVAAYGLLLPEAILEGCKLGCINIHPSALPRWRGAAPIQHTIMAGDRQTDLCIMQMDQGLDTGPVLRRESYPIAENMTAGELHDLMAEEGARLTIKVLDHYHTLTAEPQEGEVTYAHKITKDTARIDWSQPAQSITQQIRGLSPTPGAWFMLGDELIKIYQADYDNTAHRYPPGTIIDASLRIACGSGILIPTDIQRQGKRRMHIADALRGWQLPSGMIAQ